ncbi:PAS domain-containing protein [Kordiimonas gwangyangensis]|uniref:PAS domain-containing protein n=1 Tax=Kordiimonas gwangyangensis TaxID=288022 RepID=UPI000376FDD8|nr:PAS domain-containing protein [Kordiimonas gwangyangensis]
MFRKKQIDLITQTELGDFTELRGNAIRGQNKVTDFFYTYWLSKCEGGHKPSRADIRPMEISRFIDHAVIMDIDGGAESFALKVRLIGTHVTTFYGEITGHDIHDLKNQNAAERIYHICAKVIASGEPYLTVTPAFSPDRQYMEAYALYMPLYDAEGRTDKILVGVDVRSLFR